MATVAQTAENYGYGRNVSQHTVLCTLLRIGLCSHRLVRMPVNPCPPSNAPTMGHMCVRTRPWSNFYSSLPEMPIIVEGTVHIYTEPFGYNCHSLLHTICHDPIFLSVFLSVIISIISVSLVLSLLLYLHLYLLSSHC